MTKAIFTTAGNALTAYLAEENRIADLELSAEQLLGAAYLELANYKGTAAELAAECGLKPKMAGIYLAVAPAWAGDPDPAISARALRKQANRAIFEGGLGMKQFRQMVAECASVEELFNKLEKYTHKGLKAQVSAENSQDTEGDSGDKSQDKPKASLLSVVLAALPNLSAEDLDKVAEQVASLKATHATELVSA